MSIAYHIDYPLAVVTPLGINSLEDVCGVFADMIVDPELPVPAKILFDARHTDYGPPSEELEALSEFLAEQAAFRESRWAIVAHTNTLVYGLTRMFCCLAESQGMRAEPFTNYEQARQWLLETDPDEHIGRGLSRKAFAIVEPSS